MEFIKVHKSVAEVGPYHPTFNGGILQRDIKMLQHYLQIHCSQLIYFPERRFTAHSTERFAQGKKKTHNLEFLKHSY